MLVSVKRRMWHVALWGIAAVCVVALLGSPVGAPASGAAAVVNIQLTSSEPKLMESVLGGAVEKAAPTFEKLADAPTGPDGSGADPLAVWGYDRLAFEDRATALLDEMAASAPDVFGGGALDPLEPVVHIAYRGTTDQLEALAERFPELRLVYLDAPTTRAERFEVGDALAAEGYPNDPGDFDSYVRLKLDPDALAGDTNEVAKVLLAALGVGTAQSAELSDSLTKLAEQPDARLIVGPISVTLGKPDFVAYSLSAGVSLQSSTGALGLVTGACGGTDVYTSIYSVEKAGNSSPLYSVVTSP